MTETRNAKRNPVKFLGILSPLLPSLILRFAREFIRFKSRAHRAGRIFRKELVQQGLDKTTAGRLTAYYLEGSDLFKLLRALR